MPGHGGMRDGGHLYMQTNETRNCVVHYRRSADGALAEVERTATGGAGSGGYNPIVNRESTPNPFEGARSVILSRDNRLLFATNAGDNSVSSFTVDDEGRLTLVDVKRTGNIVPGPSGSAKSLAYDARQRHALRAPLARPRSRSPALGRRRGSPHRAAGALHDERRRQAQPRGHDGRALA